MSKYTKGPWEIDYGKLGQMIRIYAPLVRSYIIAKTTEHQFDDKTNKANARLISAAPELLDMLKQCLPFIGHLANFNNEQPSQTQDSAYYLKRNMEQIILKAEGK